MPCPSHLPSSVILMISGEYKLWINFPLFLFLPCSYNHKIKNAVQH
jgi:hypothetical protein